MRVLKFGGTSVASAERILEVSAIVAASIEEDRPVVVVSALAGVTNALAEAVDRVLSGDVGWRRCIDEIRDRHKRELGEIGSGNHPEVSRAIDARIDELCGLLTGVGLIGECPIATRDRILAVGERLSAPMVVAALQACGQKAEVIDGSEMIEVVRGADGAEVVAEATALRATKRLENVDQHTVPVVTGFVAADAAGKTVTMGRGGSDLTATVLGAALNCQRVEIWTDVSGVMSAPPRVVRAARTLPVLSSAEAAQLAYFGAKVLHPTCLAALAGCDIPVLIRNTLEPEGSFTEVRQDAVNQVGVRAVAAVDDVAVFELSRPLDCDKGWSHRLDCALAVIQGQLIVASRTSAEGAWTLVVPGQAADIVEARLVAHRVDGALARRRGSLLALVGGSVLAQPWVVGRALEALGRRQVKVSGLFAGSTPCAVSVLVSTDELGSALEIVHEALMLGTQADAGPVRKEVQNGKEKVERGHSRCHRECRPEARPSAA